MTDTDNSFGCSECWPQEAEPAHKGLPALKIETYLVDESHYIVTTRHCPRCSQKFLTVITETVDFAGGEDPQQRIVMPITPKENELLQRNAQAISEALLESIGVGRRSLVYDHPSDRPALIHWGSGIHVRVHD